MKLKLNESQNDLLMSLATVLEDTDFQANADTDKADAELTADELFLRDFQAALEKMR